MTKRIPDHQPELMAYSTLGKRLRDMKAKGPVNPALAALYRSAIRRKYREKRGYPANDGRIAHYKEAQIAYNNNLTELAFSLAPKPPKPIDTWEAEYLNEAISYMRKDIKSLESLAIWQSLALAFLALGQIIHVVYGCL